MQLHEAAQRRQQYIVAVAAAAAHYCRKRREAEGKVEEMSQGRAEGEEPAG